MPKFSSRSKSNLLKAHPLLQQLCNEVIKVYDFTVLDSQRGRAAQELAFKQGNTKAHFGQSAHNYTPAVALDLVPYPLDWDDYQEFIRMQTQFVLPTAKRLGIPIRWGGDWNRNGKWTDETFRDLPHIELDPWRNYAKNLIKD